MTSDASASPRRLGTLHAFEGEGVVRLEDHFPTGINDLWTALTDPHRLARWLGDVDGDLRQGGTFRARFVASGWEGTCRVKACDQPRHLVLTTASEDQPDGKFVITLTADADGTTLVVEDHGVPLDSIAAYGAGDQIHLEDLASHLAGNERCDARARWQQLHPIYQQAPIELT